MTQQLTSLMTQRKAVGSRGGTSDTCHVSCQTAEIVHRMLQRIDNSKSTNQLVASGGLLLQSATTRLL